MSPDDDKAHIELQIEARRELVLRSLDLDPSVLHCEAAKQIRSLAFELKTTGQILDNSIQFIRRAFIAHPNLDLDVENIE